MQTLTCVPSVIAAGTTVKFKRSPTDFRSDQGWTLTLFLSGASVLNKPGVADGLGGYDFTLTPADTGGLQPGNYRWDERASNVGGEVYDRRSSPSLSSGVLEVMADVSQAAAGDLQSFAEKQLAAVEARLAGRLTKDQESIQVDNMAVVKIPFEKLYGLRRTLKAEVALERRKGSFETPVRCQLTKAR